MGSITPRSTAVRQAVATDVDDVWPLASTFASTFAPREDVFRATFARVLTQDGSLLLVAEDGDGVVGYLLASAHLTFLADGEVVWVEELMVAEERRRTGVGASLMAAVDAWARDRGAAYVSLASRRAGPFYLALGYEDSATFYRRLCVPLGGATSVSEDPVRAASERSGAGPSGTEPRSG